jgi:hypothetical protein
MYDPVVQKRYRERHQIERNAKSKMYYQQNKIKMQALGRAYYHKNRNTCRLYQAKYQLTHLDEFTERQLKRRYNLTLNQYELMYIQQGKVYWICKAHSNNDKTRLCVDHDHLCCPGEKSCGRCVRGLICQSCNLMIANGRDTVEFLQQGIKYLEHFKAISDEKKALGLE